MGPRSTWKIVVGIIATVLGLVFLIGGLALAVVFGTDGRADGDVRFETTSSALTSTAVDLTGDVPLSTASGVDLQLRVRSTNDAPVFIGIGPRDEVTRYLEGVAIEQIDEVRFGPFRYESTPMAGDRAPAPPGEQTFWVARAEGAGQQTLNWEIESGTFQAVVMNADGTPGVAVDGRFGIGISWIFPVAIVLAVLGAVLLAGGILLIVSGSRRRPLPAGPSFSAPPTAGQAPPPPPTAGQAPPPPPPPATG